jgi:inorganic pyrophosphatase
MKTLEPFSRHMSFHSWHDVDPGSPSSFTAIVEIPLGSSNKYELDKKTGLLKLDRVLHSAVFYPANYGFIPRTLADDGDPLDVLILAAEPVFPLTMVTARPIGLMTMMDQNELDYKVIAVGVHDPEYNAYHDVHELPKHRVAVIRRFFEDYKTLENKRVVVDDILPAIDAIPVIEKSFAVYREYVGTKPAAQG